VKPEQDNRKNDDGQRTAYSSGTQALTVCFVMLLQIQERIVGDITVEMDIRSTK
jgi:hypothetical protein